MDIRRRRLIGLGIAILGGGGAFEAYRAGKAGYVRKQGIALWATFDESLERAPNRSLNLSNPKERLASEVFRELGEQHYKGNGFSEIPLVMKETEYPYLTACHETIAKNTLRQFFNFSLECPPFVLVLSPPVLNGRTSEELKAMFGHELSHIAQAYFKSSFETNLLGSDAIYVSPDVAVGGGSYNRASGTEGEESAKGIETLADIEGARYSSTEAAESALRKMDAQMKAYFESHYSPSDYQAMMSVYDTRRDPHPSLEERVDVIRGRTKR